MTREEAVSIIKRMNKGDPTKIQLEALGMAYKALQEPKRKKGHWIEYIDDYANYCLCSNCNYQPDAPLDTTPFCPNCGAEME